MMTMMKFHSFEHLLSFRAAEAPNDPALIFEKDGSIQFLSYRGLYLEVLQRAREMKTGGKTCLGILCDGSTDCILTIFAGVLSGMQIVLLDENAPEDLLSEQIIYTDTDSLWGDEELVKLLSPSLTGGVKGGGEGHLLFFTSGTTQQCKAVVLTDRSLMASAYNGSCMLPLSQQDRLLCMLPLNHVFGFVCSLLWGLNCGASVAVGRGPRHYADDPAFFSPTVISAVPMLLGFLIKQQALDPQLHTILVGAGDCPQSLISAVAAHEIRLCFGYGLTETSSGVAISLFGDPYAMEVCPEDTITIAPDGEILIDAPSCMMQGYYKKDEETALVLQDGVLHTGDLGYMDEAGRLHITGRKKEMIVLADGTKIFLPEYEEKLRMVLPDTEFAVIEKEQLPVLVVRVPSAGSVSASEAIRKEIQKRIAPVMIQYPRGQQIRDLYIVTEPLPRTPTGKICRWEIPRMLSDSKAELVK